MRGGFFSASFFLGILAYLHRAFFTVVFVGRGGGDGEREVRVDYDAMHWINLIFSDFSLLVDFGSAVLYPWHVDVCLNLFFFALQLQPRRRISIGGLSRV